MRLAGLVFLGIVISGFGQMALAKIHLLNPSRFKVFYSLTSPEVGPIVGNSTCNYCRLEIKNVLLTQTTARIAEVDDDGEIEQEFFLNTKAPVKESIAWCFEQAKNAVNAQKILVVDTSRSDQFQCAVGVELLSELKRAREKLTIK